jgi:hypothetical protein
MSSGHLATIASVIADLSRLGHKVLGGLLVFSAIALFSGLAKADPEALHLVYRAPAECPDESAFVDLLRARTTQIRLSSEGARRTFDVTLETEAGRFSGTLQVVDLGGVSTRRRFASGDCAEVASALAILTALAVDPAASPAASPVAPVATDASPPPSDAVLPLPEQGFEPDRVTSASTESTRHWRVGTGAGLALEGGVAPAALVAFDVFAEVSRAGTGPWSPSLRLGALYAQTGLLGADVSEARFQWGAARADGCPLRLFFASLETRPCAVVELGVLHAQGLDVAVPGDATRPWASAGLTARARWTHGLLFAELEMGGLLPITRPTFVFETPRVVVQGVPAVLFTGETSVGVTFL